MNVSKIVFNFYTIAKMNEIELDANILSVQKRFAKILRKFYIKVYLAYTVLDVIYCIL